MAANDAMVNLGIGAAKVGETFKKLAEELGIVSEHTVNNRWDEVTFRTINNFACNLMTLKVTGMVFGTYVYGEGQLARELLAQTDSPETVIKWGWATATEMFAREAEKHGDPWFAVNLELSHVKYLGLTESNPCAEIELEPSYAWSGFESGVRKFADMVPGIYEAVKCPGGCEGDHAIYYTIQHLNDEHEWDREQIADWLDTLDIDLTIKEK